MIQELSNFLYFFLVMYIDKTYTPGIPYHSLKPLSIEIIYVIVIMVYEKELSTELRIWQDKSHVP